MSSTPTIIEVLAQGPATVKAIAEATNLSDSRVREVLKKIPNVESRKDGTAPAEFWIEAGEEEPAGTEPTDTCPLCKSHADQAPAGAEGTFLGACKTCSDCGKTYNAVTGKELRDNPSSRTKRAPLNPQYKIQAKTQALEAAGGKLTFDKASRQWIVTKADGAIHRLTAKQFSELSPETIVTYND